MARTSASKKKSGRKNFRFPADLLEWAEDYVQRKNTNLTQLLTDHLTSLREKEEKHHGRR